MAINSIQAPINYMAQVPQVDLAQGLTSGLQLGAIYRETQDKQIEQQRLQQVRQQFSDDLQAAQTDGSQRAWAGMIAKYPQFREAFSDVRKAAGEERVNTEFTQGFEISNALENGAPDIAMSRLQIIIDAKKNSGEPTKIYEDVLTALQSGNIKGAQSGVNLALTAMDPDRFEKSVKARTTAATASSVETEAKAKSDKAVSDAITAQATATNAEEKAKADAAKAAADANKAKIDAQYAGPLAQASLNLTGAQIKNINNEISNRAAKLNLDVQATQATVAEKLSSIQARLTDLPEGSRKLINESATAAAVSKQAATQYNDLASRIEAAQGGKGRLTSASEWFATQLGQQDAWTQIRNDYTRVRNSVAIKSLPPGVATDKDIELALKGIPPETANAATLASFLRGTAKLQDIDSSINNAKTDWLSQNNGLLTRAKSTFVAGDYATKPGETFNDFAQRIVGDVSKKYRSPEQIAEERRQESIARIPTTNTPTAAPPDNVRARADAILSGAR
jgi:hypothetical protein